MIRSGGCSCGRVRYTLEGEPFLVGICHCTTCRKESGSVLVVYAKWSLDRFRCTGSPRVFKGKSFCDECGSRLFNLHEHDVEIRIGSLDDAPSGLVPAQEGWTIRREHWLQPVFEVAQYDRDPPR